MKRLSPRTACRRRLEAFTPIELLVVIPIIPILAVVLLPALAKAKCKAVSIQCVSNLKPVQVDWQMYPRDDDDVMLPNAELRKWLAPVLKIPAVAGFKHASIGTGMTNPDWKWYTERAACKS